VIRLAIGLGLAAGVVAIGATSPETAVLATFILAAWTLTWLRGQSLAGAVLVPVLRLGAHPEGVGTTRAPANRLGVLCVIRR
jgi:hypothetical protein